MSAFGSIMVTNITMVGIIRVVNMEKHIVTGSWHWTLVQGTQLQEGPKR